MSAFGVPLVVGLAVAVLLRSGALAEGRRETGAVDDTLPVGAPVWHRASDVALAQPRPGSADPGGANRAVRGESGEAAGTPAQQPGGEVTMGEGGEGMVGEASGTISIDGYLDDGEEYFSYPRYYRGYRYANRWYSLLRRLGQPAYMFLQPSGGGDPSMTGPLGVPPTMVLGGGGGGGVVVSASSSAQPGSRGDAAAPASLQRDADGRWTMRNGLTEVVIDPRALCVMRVRAAGTPSDPPSASASAAELRFATPEPDAGCVLTPQGDDAGRRASVLLAWRGAGWAQRVELSLAAGAGAPEAVLRLVRDAETAGDAAGSSAAPRGAVAYVANLTAERIDAGDGTTVAPGAISRVALPGDADADGT